MSINRTFVVFTAMLVLVPPADAVRAADPTSDPFHQDVVVLPAVPNVDAARTQSTCRPTTDVTFRVEVPNLSPGLEMRAGFLLLQPSSDDLGYAVLTNVRNPASVRPVASPFWTIQTLTPDYEPAFEVGARYLFADSGNDLRVLWQHLRTSTSSSVVAEPDLQWVSPFSQTGPSSAESFDDLGRSQGVNKLKSAVGQANFAYDVVNLDVGQHVTVGPAIHVRAFTGLSYARLQQRLVSSFFGPPPDANAVFPQSVPLFISLNQTSTYNGVGPRFGLDFTYEAPRGFRLVGQCAGALLVGRKEPSQYLFTATAPELALVGIPVNQEHISSDAFTQVVYSFDAKVGIAYSHDFCNGSTFALEAGFLAATYIGAFSAYQTNHNILPLQIGSLSTASMRHTLSDFTVNGVYFSAGFKF